MTKTIIVTIICDNIYSIKDVKVKFKNFLHYLIKSINNNNKTQETLFQR